MLFVRPTKGHGGRYRVKLISRCHGSCDVKRFLKLAYFKTVEGLLDLMPEYRCKYTHEKSCYGLDLFIVHI